MLQSLQVCRAVAAALVVLFHLGGTFAQDRYFGFKALDGPFAWGDAGVDFFFVLSGFIITMAHRADFGRPQALRGYLGKRLVRIFPTYWVVCAGVCAAALAVPSLAAALPSDTATFVRALLLLPQDPARVGGTGSPILFVAWSLHYELLFYALVAVFIANITAGVAAAAAVLALGAGCQWSAQCGFPASFVATPMIFLFAMGVAGAYVATSRWQMAAPLAWAALGSAGFVAVGWWEVAAGRDALPLDRHWLFGAMALVIVVALAQAEARGLLVLRRRWPALLGDASYALYLLHVPVISLLVKLVRGLGITQPALLVAAFVAIFAACVAASVAFHVAVERPLLARLRRRPRRAAGVAAGRPAAGAKVV